MQPSTGCCSVMPERNLKDYIHVDYIPRTDFSFSLILCSCYRLLDAPSPLLTLPPFGDHYYPKFHTLSPSRTLSLFAYNRVLSCIFSFPVEVNDLIRTIFSPVTFVVIVEENLGSCPMAPCAPRISLWVASMSYTQKVWRYECLTPAPTVVFPTG